MQLVAFLSLASDGIEGRIGCSSKESGILTLPDPASGFRD
jgi:hypothetical protein